MDAVDVAILGGGPAGLFAVFCAGSRGLSTALIDELPHLGGRVMTVYPDKLIHDVPGFPAIRGRDLVANLKVQASKFTPAYHLNVVVEGLAYRDARPVLRLAGGRAVRCGALLIAGGIGAPYPRALPAAEKFAGTGVVHTVHQTQALSGQHVLIVGGGDSALDWAQALAPVATSVTLVHRRDVFRAHAASVARVRELPVRIITNAEVTRLHGEARVTGADIRSTPSGRTSTVPADTVVVALGFHTNSGRFARWGLKLGESHIAVDSTMATNLPRVFAAGEVAEYPGKARLLVTGFGEAATAVGNAAVTIH